MKQGLYKQLDCIHCNYPIEDDRYILFDYNFPSVVWQHISKRNKWNQIQSLSFKDLVYSVFAKSSKEEISIFATTVWLIWFAMNKFSNMKVSNTNATSINPTSL